MTFILLYVMTFAVFLALDFLGLSYLVSPVFRRDVGHLMHESFRLLPALAFYMFFMFVLLWFVSWPAMTADKSLAWVLGNAMLLGALGYGTYEFTNLAILKDWTWRLVWLDGIWGTLLTGVSATLGVWLTRLIV
ncbi:MAG: DUF2177 family protein [Pseudomonadota bacterium]